MSKAFTSEETPDAAPLARPPPQLAPGELRLVTPEGQAALRASLAALNAERADVTRLPELQRPAALTGLGQRIAVLEATLAALTVLGPDDTPEGKVGFATWVRVTDEAGKRRTWRIVGPDEADPRQGLLSVCSPIARALMGLGVGDSAEVQRPGGAVELSVEAVFHAAP